jgi:hypothetical protein
MASIINATTTNGVVASGDNSGSLQLATNNGTTAVTIDTSQNVGIGTTSPAFKTEIVGGATTVETTLLQIRSNAGGINTGTTIALANSTNTTAGSGRVELAALRDTSSGSSFVVRTADSSGTVTERMRIDSFGRVYLNAYSNNLYGNNAQQLAINTGTTGLSIQTTDTRSTGFWTNSGSAGTSNAATYLQFFNNSAQTNVGSVTSTGTNCLYNNLSDYRLKEDISPISNGLSLVSALKPVTFKWSSNQTEDVGFIAHEFQEIIPNFVTGNKDAVDEEGKPIYQAMDSSGAIPLLVAAIQELNAKVEAQAAEIAALKGAQ